MCICQTLARPPHCSTGTLAGRVLLHDAISGTCLGGLTLGGQRPVACLAFVDGDTLAVAAEGGDITIIRLDLKQHGK